MAARTTLKRKAFFVDEEAVRRARKALGTASDAEAIRTSLDRIAEMEGLLALHEAHAAQPEARKHRDGLG